MLSESLACRLVNRGLDDRPGISRSFRDPHGGLMKFATLVVFALVAGAIPAFAQEQEIVLAAPAFEQQSGRACTLAQRVRSVGEVVRGVGEQGRAQFRRSADLGTQEASRTAGMARGGMSGRLVADGPACDACYLLRHWEEQPLLILQRRTSSLAASSGTVDDKVVKSSFFRRIHLTGGWAGGTISRDAGVRHRRHAGRSVRGRTIHAARGRGDGGDGS